MRIYFSDGKLWVCKDVMDRKYHVKSYAMLSDLEYFTPEELKQIARWIADKDWTDTRPIYGQEMEHHGNENA